MGKDLCVEGDTELPVQLHPQSSSGARSGLTATEVQMAKGVSERTIRHADTGECAGVGDDGSMSADEAAEVVKGGQSSPMSRRIGRITARNLAI
ncbi:MAG: hypothetical protein OXI90_16840 [Gammaproteobacteria bacterium]|nr:hypothetical protein [Gammaproteobacteria bacterium]